jgi:uncharacterized small protein (DUF1192 family)
MTNEDNLIDDRRAAVTVIAEAVGPNYTMLGTARQAARCAALEIADLRAALKQASGERDAAVALNAYASGYLLSGVDEKTPAGRFWANEFRHVYTTAPTAALARVLADEIERVGVEVAYDAMFFDESGNTSTGMRRAVGIMRSMSDDRRSETLVATL